VFLRSPHAHAEIVAIGKAEALAAPGVAAIFTAEDVTADKLNGVPCAWGIRFGSGRTFCRFMSFVPGAAAAALRRLRDASSASVN
jgi:CO/xanthine dehydrogenase Mo-binding subunit